MLVETFHCLMGGPGLKIQFCYPDLVAETGPSHRQPDLEGLASKRDLYPKQGQRHPDIEQGIGRLYFNFLPHGLGVAGLGQANGDFFRRIRHEGEFHTAVTGRSGIGRSGDGYATVDDLH